AVAGGNLLERDRKAHVVEPRTAPRLGNDDAEHAERPERAQRVARERMVPIPRRGVRRKLVARERAERVADLLLLGRKQHQALDWNARGAAGAANTPAS